MNKIYLGDFSALNLPRDLPVLVEEVKAGLTSNVDLSELYSSLASEHPIALCELCVGPKAMRGSIAVRQALRFASELEKSMQPKALYRRLIELGKEEDPKVAKETAVIVINEAVRRHPGAKWVLPLCEKFEDTPGEAHLNHAINTDCFESVCWDHAEAGHFEALFNLAQKGHVECAAAILSTGNFQLAIKAAAEALNHTWESPVVPWFYAVVGHKADELLLNLIPYIRSGQAARAIHAQSGPLPKTQKLISIVLPGLK